MAITCTRCSKKAHVKKPKTGDILCKECFFFIFEEEIHHTIISGKLFSPGDKVAIGASGGKDSTVLIHVMKVLNERHDYRLDLVLLSIDEGITGYRDDSLETVKINQLEYDLPLKIISYQDLYGWTMDAIVKETGLRNNCTFCGVFRRQALDRGGMLMNVDKIVTGHNADDIAETVMMNMLRGDIARLPRCTDLTTGQAGHLPRCKPFKYTYEKDIVMYAFHKKLTYFSTECIYSPNAYRGFVRSYIKDLERIQPRAIIDIVHSGENLQVKKEVRMPTQTTCSRCGYISSNELCKACIMLEGLNRGRPRLGIGMAPHKERPLWTEQWTRHGKDHASDSQASLGCCSADGLRSSRHANSCHRPQDCCGCSGREGVIVTDSTLHGKLSSDGSLFCAGDDNVNAILSKATSYDVAPSNTSSSFASLCNATSSNVTLSDAASKVSTFINATSNSATLSSDTSSSLTPSNAMSIITTSASTTPRNDALSYATSDGSTLCNDIAISVTSSNATLSDNALSIATSSIATLSISKSISATSCNHALSNST